MPFYNTATAAAAIGVTPKWLDNLLSHNNIAGVPAESQGVSRRLSFETIVVLSLARELIDTLELKAPAALNLAARIMQTPGGEIVLSADLRINVRADVLKSTVLGRLARAVEIAPSPRRGRPPAR